MKKIKLAAGKHCTGFYRTTESGVSVTSARPRQGRSQGGVTGVMTPPPQIF